MLVGGLYALFAAGLSLIFGVMRLVNIAHGDLIVAAAYLGYVVVEATGLSPLLRVLRSGRNIIPTYYSAYERPYNEFYFIFILGNLELKTYYEGFIFNILPKLSINGIIGCTFSDF